MKDVFFSLPGVALTILCWGVYGSVLHKGQHDLGGSRLKPLICVGLAYFVIAIVLPCILLAIQGKLQGDWSFSGISWALAAGAAGALGALGIILALTAGGKPTYVMPLVFGGAPIINVVVSMYFAKIPWREINPVFYAGLIMVGAGAVTVLVFAPKKKPTPTPVAATPVAVEKSAEDTTSQAAEKQADDAGPDDAAPNDAKSSN